MVKRGKGPKYSSPSKNNTDKPKEGTTSSVFNTNNTETPPSKRIAQQRKHGQHSWCAALAKCIELFQGVSKFDPICDQCNKQCHYCCSIWKDDTNIICYNCLDLAPITISSKNLFSALQTYIGNSLKHNITNFKTISSMLQHIRKNTKDPRTIPSELAAKIVRYTDTPIGDDNIEVQQPLFGQMLKERVLMKDFQIAKPPSIEHWLITATLVGEPCPHTVDYGSNEKIGLWMDSVGPTLISLRTLMDIARLLYIDEELTTITLFDPIIKQNVLQDIKRHVVDNNTNFQHAPDHIIKHFARVFNIDYLSHLTLGRLDINLVRTMLRRLFSAGRLPRDFEDFFFFANYDPAIHKTPEPFYQWIDNLCEDDTASMNAIMDHLRCDYREVLHIQIRVHIENRLLNWIQMSNPNMMECSDLSIYYLMQITNWTIPDGLVKMDKKELLFNTVRSKTLGNCRFEFELHERLQEDTNFYFFTVSHNDVINITKKLKEWIINDAQSEPISIKLAMILKDMYQIKEIPRNFQPEFIQKVWDRAETMASSHNIINILKDKSPPASPNFEMQQLTIKVEEDYNDNDPMSMEQQNIPSAQFGSVNWCGTRLFCRVRTKPEDHVRHSCNTCNLMVHDICCIQLHNDEFICFMCQPPDDKKPEAKTLLKSTPNMNTGTSNVTNTSLVTAHNKLTQDTPPRSNRSNTNKSTDQHQNNRSDTNSADVSIPIPTNDSIQLNLTTTSLNSVSNIPQIQQSRTTSTQLQNSSSNTYLIPSQRPITPNISAMATDNQAIGTNQTTHSNNAYQLQQTNNTGSAANINNNQSTANVTSNNTSQTNPNPIRNINMTTRFDVRLRIYSSCSESAFDWFAHLKQIDSNAMILPWVIEGSNERYPPIRDPVDIPEQMNILSKYFVRIQDKRPGEDTWTDVHLSHSLSWDTILRDFGDWLREQHHNTYPKILQVPFTAVCGWLLYSYKEISRQKLANELSTLLDDKQIELSYRTILINKWLGADEDRIPALHVISAREDAPYIRDKLLQVYEKSVTEFPLNIRLRFVLPSTNVTRRKWTNLFKLRQRQGIFLNSIITVVSRDFIKSVDQEIENTNMRRLLSLFTSAETRRQLFLSVDPAYSNPTLTLFTFSYVVEMEARNIIENLYFNLRRLCEYHYIDPWFSEGAIQHGSHHNWNVENGEVITAYDRALEDICNIEDDEAWLQLDRRVVLLNMPTDAETRHVHAMFNGDEQDTVDTGNSRNSTRTFRQDNIPVAVAVVDNQTGPTTTGDHGPVMAFPATVIQAEVARVHNSSFAPGFHPGGRQRNDYTTPSNTSNSRIIPTPISTSSNISNFRNIFPNRGPYARRINNHNTSTHPTNNRGTNSRHGSIYTNVTPSTVSNSNASSTSNTIGGLSSLSGGGSANT